MFGKKKFKVTSSKVDPAGKKTTITISTDDESIVRKLLDSKKEAMDAEFKETKKASGTNKKNPKPTLKSTKEASLKALPSPRTSKPLAKQGQRKEAEPTAKKEASNTKGIYTTSELRKKLRSMVPYKEELVLGNNVIVKTSNGYGIRNINDHDDPMTDYSAYVYGFKEKWIIERARKNGLLKD